MRRASVALCVLEHEGHPCVVVIKRAYRGRNAGQWALPGGRVDGDETAVAAGLRELHEEIGLVASPTDVLGRLDDFPAASGFAITPPSSSRSTIRAPSIPTTTRSMPCISCGSTGSRPTMCRTGSTGRTAPGCCSSGSGTR
ncbi:CoA pyrophosphatase [Nocardia africana]|nr:CoA pyrophosphatase [Nocardia africana]